MENSKNLIGAVFVIMATVFMASGASAADDDLSDLVESVGCDAIGGTTIPQPAGSAITACCTETECYICDENGGDCTLDDSYRDPTNPTAGNFTKPVLNAGTMIERPGTNPPANTRVKPTAPEAAIQNLIRN